MRFFSLHLGVIWNNSLTASQHSSHCDAEWLLARDQLNIDHFLLVGKVEIHNCQAYAQPSQEIHVDCFKVNRSQILILCVLNLSGINLAETAANACNANILFLANYMLPFIPPTHIYIYIYLYYPLFYCQPVKNHFDTKQVPFALLNNKGQNS